MHHLSIGARAIGPGRPCFVIAEAGVLNGVLQDALDVCGFFFPPMPLKLNIPCCPTVIAQPRPGLTGQWETLMVEHGLNASFISERGQLSGFVLMGEETAEAPFLQDEIPNWMNL